MKLPTLAFASVIAATAGMAHAQTWSASCDNRSGTTFADVIDSSDATQSGYNIDPSQNFQTLNNLSFPASQSSAGNSATAGLTVVSRFFGNNPSVRITGFRSDSNATASATRVNTNVRAFANDNTRVCFNLAGASAGSPAIMRLSGSIAVSGTGTSGQIRLQNPSNADIANISTGSLNRVIRFTTNGTYSLTALANTGDLQINSGASTQSRSARTIAAFTCIGDYNGSGDITVQDIFDFLAGYFAGNLAADSNASGGNSVQDIFDFLAVYFTNCI